MATNNVSVSFQEAEGEQTEVSENEKLLEAKVVEMEEKNADLLDKYRRSLADFENLRNRSATSYLLFWLGVQKLVFL